MVRQHNTHTHAYTFPSSTTADILLCLSATGWQFVISEAVPPVQEVKSYAFNFLPEAVDKYVARDTVRLCIT